MILNASHLQSVIFFSLRHASTCSDLVLKQLNIVVGETVLHDYAVEQGFLISAPLTI